MCIRDSTTGGREGSRGEDNRRGHFNNVGLSLPREASLASPRGAVRELGPRERREGVRVFAADGAPHPAGRTGENGHAGDVRGDARVERRDAGHLLQEIRARRLRVRVDPRSRERRRRGRLVRLGARGPALLLGRARRRRGGRRLRVLGARAQLVPPAEGRQLRRRDARPRSRRFGRLGSPFCGLDARAQLLELGTSFSRAE